MSSRSFGLGLVLPMFEHPETGRAPSWSEISRAAQDGEALGFDTTWIADELLWRIEEWKGPSGWWEGVAISAGVAAVTTEIAIGSWVLSSLHRNPGITVKAAQTIDEISNGRFVFGYGSGHAGGQGEAFGLPLDKTVGRYEEALQIVVPALKGQAVSYSGEYYSAQNLEARPAGPQGGAIPLMLAGHGPRTMGLAVDFGDIWSCYAQSSSKAPAFAEMIDRFKSVCEERGRDPESIGKSVGVFVEPGTDGRAEAVGFGEAITGSVEEMATDILALTELGFTQVELMPFFPPDEIPDKLGPLLAALDE